MSGSKRTGWESCVCTPPGYGICAPAHPGARLPSLRVHAPPSTCCVLSTCSVGPTRRRSAVCTLWDRSHCVTMCLIPSVVHHPPHVHPGGCLSIRLTYIPDVFPLHLGTHGYTHTHPLVCTCSSTRRTAQSVIPAVSMPPPAPSCRVKTSLAELWRTWRALPGQPAM